MDKILVTGAAGFIGFHVAKELLIRGHEVVGFDNFNEYYDPCLKEARAAQLAGSGFEMIRGDLGSDDIRTVFESHTFGRVVHLAAQAGVRYSLDNPQAYASSNVVGFLNILEGCRHSDVKHLVYASSSSVYGANVKTPFSLSDSVDHPVSLYAATKKANELMAHSYSHLFGLPTTGLRFFTVYGPWGRPDMAYFKFTKAILEGVAIDVFNHGDMRRDFTYITDIVQGVVKTLDCIPKADPSWDRLNPTPESSYAPYRVYNIGNNQPVQLLRFIEIIEASLGKKAVLNMLPMQPGDVHETFADVEALARDVGFRPSTSLEDGLAEFVKWYRGYYA